MDEKNVYVRPKEAAHLLSISLPTFWRYTHRPGFPRGLKIGPAVTVFARAELLQWVQRQPSNKKEA